MNRFCVTLTALEQVCKYEQVTKLKTITQSPDVTLRQVFPVLGSNVTVNVPFVLGATRTEWTGEKVL